jgi:hypothetical protein
VSSQNDIFDLPIRSRASNRATSLTPPLKDNHPFFFLNPAMPGENGFLPEMSLAPAAVQPNPGVVAAEFRSLLIRRVQFKFVDR